MVIGCQEPICDASEFFLPVVAANAATASVYECLRKGALSAKMNVSACAREAP
jgi:hypothetical protein